MRVLKATERLANPAFESRTPNAMRSALIQDPPIRRPACQTNKTARKTFETFLKLLKNESKFSSPSNHIDRESGTSETEECHGPVSSGSDAASRPESWANPALHEAVTKAAVSLKETEVEFKMFYKKLRDYDEAVNEFQDLKSKRNTEPPAAMTLAIRTWMKTHDDL